MLACNPVLDGRRQLAGFPQLPRRHGMAFQMNHVHLKTTDPKKTAQFYVDNLGAKIVSENPNGYRLDLHGLMLNVTTFIASQTREQRYGMEHIAIDTDAMDELVNKLKAKGIEILEETSITGGRRVCFFEGPDGVQLEFIEMQR
jgi:catechol 2,3-dioxygenase-like lactoylglutathione lyase family enzyme